MVFNDIFVSASIVNEYAWNSAPIDRTDILHNIPATNQELHFPIDINIITLLKLTQNNDQATLEYFKHNDSSHHFSKYILNFFIDDRRTAHAERIHNSRNLVILNPGDILMVRTSIQSNTS